MFLAHKSFLRKTLNCQKFPLSFCFALTLDKVRIPVLQRHIEFCPEPKLRVQDRVFTRWLLNHNYIFNRIFLGWKQYIRNFLFAYWLMRTNMFDKLCLVNKCFSTVVESLWRLDVWIEDKTYQKQFS